MKSTLIFVPNVLNFEKIGNLEGFSKFYNNELVFYITNDELLTTCNSVIGYCSDNIPNCIHITNNTPWIHVKRKTGFTTVIGLSNNFDFDKEIIYVRYDYDVLKKSDLKTFAFENYGEHFEILANAVQEKYLLESQQNFNKIIYSLWNIMIFMLSTILIIINLLLKVFDKGKFIINYSTTFDHFKKTTEILKWSIVKLKKEQKLSVGVGNIMISKLIDFLLGISILYLLFQYEAEFIKFIQDTTESIIRALEKLLNFLMGSPVGLKLNYAFNTTLGGFFLYHISLWKSFLHTMSPILKLGFHLLVIPGSFGLSFQAALVSDLVTFSTFHIYCIYVYAARLYGVQVRGIISLSHLFIGRKYNPLRQRVDSHKYNHHQLFIGTLGFTILLFLLPTTLLYYSVFTFLRLCLVVFDRILIHLRYKLQRLPIYVGFLWLVNSPTIKGTIRLSICRDFAAKLVVHATLENVSLQKILTHNFPATFVDVPIILWTDVFQNVLAGSLL